jgi:predicted Ser/Thr protein kinase
MSLWLITVQAFGQTPHATQWIQCRFVIGSEMAHDIFTVQGEGILPRHVRVVLGEQSATLEPLCKNAQTNVQGVPLKEAFISEYPVRLRIGNVDVLVDRVASSPSTPHVLAVVSGDIRNTSGELKEDLRATPDNEASRAEKYYQRTMAFGLEIVAAPFSKFVTVEKIYTLKGEIGRGGMGRVFLAEDRTLNRQVALKVGHTGDATQKAAFYREAKILSRLSHPNIVPVHNFGEDAAGRPFYSMKLVRGQTLQRVIKNLRKNDLATALDFSRQRLLSVFRRVCNAIEFAHSAGYMHRDIKPENVMIGEYGEVWVMDWGLAQALGQASSPNYDDASQHDRKYAVEGTPQYMSPEQASGNSLDERTDIYSLGATLYAILTLQAPVQGVSLKEILRKVKSGAVSAMESPPLKRRVAWREATKQKRIPSGLQAVVRKAMQLDSFKRYKRVTDLICDIEAYQGGFATSAEDAGVIRKIELLIRRHRALAAVLAFSLACGAISAVRLAASQRDARAQALFAKKNAWKPAYSVSSARESECLGVEVCKACRIVMTYALLAPAGIPENDSAQLFRIAPFTLEAPVDKRFNPGIFQAKRKDEMIVLLSYGTVQLVKWISDARPALGKVPAQDLRLLPLFMPLLLASRDVASSAVFSRLQTPREAAGRPVEMMPGSLEVPPMRSGLNVSLKFFLTNQFPFDSADPQLPGKAPDETSGTFIATHNESVDWTRNAAGIPSSKFTGGSEEKKQVVRVYLGKQIVELNAVTKAFFCTMLPSEN